MELVKCFAAHSANTMPGQRLAVLWATVKVQACSLSYMLRPLPQVAPKRNAALLTTASGELLTSW